MDPTSPAGTRKGDVEEDSDENPQKDAAAAGEELLRPSRRSLFLMVFAKITGRPEATLRELNGEFNAQDGLKLRF